MEEEIFIYRHILLTNTATVERYTSPKSGQRGPFKTPPRDRFRHSEHLLRQLEETRQEALQLSQERTAFGVTAEEGIYLSFKSDPGFELRLDSLESARSGIELLAVRKIDKLEWATVFVPEGKLTYFIKKVEAYRDKLTGKIKNPLNQPLVDSISDIRKATLEGLWTDERKLFPTMEENIWWEVWLRTGSDGTITVENFKKFAPRIGLRIGEGEISFPERSILLVFGNIAQMTRSLDLLNCIAEVRKAKDNPEIFMRMTPHEQAEWVREAIERISLAPSDDVSVCLLDTGVNRAHPLIEGSLANVDMHAYDPAWGASDHHGHGTELAGLTLYGDLVDLFADSMPVQLSHRLESVKILPPAGYGENDPRLYGDITRECVARAEITAPYRKRIVSMAVTAPDFRDRGRPSSWSAAIDQLASGADGDSPRRLLVLSAGNSDYDSRHLYPENNITESVHDFGQAWNALCVGAYTEKMEIDQKEYPGWRPIAPAGDLSPSSCCSATWQSLWPIKPDIVMEGGNDAINPGTGRTDFVDSLQLLTTNWRPADRLLTVAGETSAATALAARMAAIIQAEYPEFWPETVRALMVHSADWTKIMKSRLFPLGNRGKILELLQLYGYGVPHLAQALKSAANSLTLIVQNELQPYDRIDKQYKTRDIHIHTLPWPVDVLESLADTKVEMRVTLSYFIEPNPAERGWRKKHTYHSHGLRFDVKTPTEDIGQFRWRINKTARDEEDHIESKSDASEWDLGPQLRSRGSLHSDRWYGTAAALAQRECLAVFPVNGWWKERHHLGRWNRSAHYSLIITISTPEINVDLYTPVLNRIAVETRV